MSKNININILYFLILSKKSFCDKARLTTTDLRKKIPLAMEDKQLNSKKIDLLLFAIYTYKCLWVKDNDAYH
jgi:hypothetical protein